MINTSAILLYNGDLGLCYISYDSREKSLVQAYIDLCHGTVTPHIDRS